MSDYTITRKHTAKNYMVGTKFYRYDENGLIEIIRLKKIIKEGVYLFDIGYRDLYLSALEFSSLTLNHGLEKRAREHYKYQYHDIYRDPQYQLWKLENQGEELHKFKVFNRGITLDENELDLHYTKLVPDGFIVIGIIGFRGQFGVNIEKDILMTVHKDKDPMPAIICRQDISDPRDEGNSPVPRVGGSIYTPKYPEIDFTNLLQYENMTQRKVIAIYAEDTVNTILHYINPVTKYNTVLKRIHDRDDNFRHYQGLSSNLLELLRNTYFYTDFAALFGIGLYPMPLNFEGGKMTHEQEMMFNGLFSYGDTRYNNLSYEPYTRQIDISNTDIMPIRDNCNGADVGDLFIVRSQS